MYGGTRLVFALGLICLAVLASGENVSGVEPNCDLDYLPNCTREYEPLCGTDGKTYPNECMMCVTNSLNKDSVHVTIRSRGEC